MPSLAPDGSWASILTSELQSCHLENKDDNSLAVLCRKSKAPGLQQTNVSCYKALHFYHNCIFQSLSQSFYQPSND